MAFYHIVAAAAAILGAVECADISGLVKRQAPAVAPAAAPVAAPKMIHNATHTVIKMPDWNYANSTTKDATADGKVGVILEDDIVEGKPGKDGATVKKGMNIPLQDQV
jgi:hypothetical protein